MRTGTGVWQKREEADKGPVSNNYRALLACSLIAMMTVAIFNSGAQASPVRLASYSPTENFVVSSLKESSAIATRVPQESLSSRYDVVPVPIEPTVPLPPAAPPRKRVNLVKSLTAQAACRTGGLFDACPGFMTLLEAKQQAWPRMPDASSPPARKLHVLLASVGEASSLFTGRDVTAPVDRLSSRTGEVIMGAASTYNPYNADDNDAGGAETASGELYSPIAWTAAIQTDLRDKVGGVRFGRLYKPAFALIELNGKRAVVKINDVGPLRPGRVVDLSQQVMHYFDPSLQRGVLDGVLVTPLVGTDWTPGPLGTAPAVAVASNL